MARLGRRIPFKTGSEVTSKPLVQSDDQLTSGIWSYGTTVESINPADGETYFEFRFISTGDLPTAYIARKDSSERPWGVNEPLNGLRTAGDSVYKGANGVYTYQGEVAGAVDLTTDVWRLGFDASGHFQFWQNGVVVWTDTEVQSNGEYVLFHRSQNLTTGTPNGLNYISKFPADYPQYQTGLASILDATSQTQTGIADILATTTQTQTGISAVLATTTQTQTGIADILTTATQTQTGIADILTTATQTQTGLSRITTTGTATQTGISRITTTGTAAQTGIASISGTTTQTQTGISDILATTTQTQTGVADIAGTTAQTQNGISRISIISTKTQTGVSRITASVSQTQTGIASVYGTTTRTQTGIAYVTTSVQRTQTGVARIQTTQTSTQTGISRITNVVTRTQTAVSRITKVVQETQTGVASIYGTTTQTQTGVADILVTTSQTQTGVADISGTTTQTQTGLSRISVTNTQTQTAVSRITTVVAQTQTGIADIAGTTTRTQTGISQIAGGSLQTQTGISRITATSTQTQLGIARVGIVSTQTQTGVSKITLVVSQTQTGIADILATTTQTQTGIATISTASIQTQTGVARIEATSSQTQTGVADILATTTQTQTGVSRISIVSSQAQTGVARITVVSSQTQTGVANIQSAIATTTQTQTGIASISDTTTQTQTGIAKISLFGTQSTTGKSKIVNGYTVFKTTNGANASSTTPIEINGALYAAVSYITLSAPDPYWYLVKSVDNGQTWTIVDTSLASTANGYDFVSSSYGDSEIKVDGDYGYIVTSGNLTDTVTVVRFNHTTDTIDDGYSVSITTISRAYETLWASNGDLYLIGSVLHSGSHYKPVYARLANGAGAWSAYVDLDPAPMGVQNVLSVFEDSVGRIHFVFGEAPSGGFIQAYHRSWNGATLSTKTAITGCQVNTASFNVNSGIGVSRFGTDEVGFAVLSSSNQIQWWAGTEADTPTFSSSTIVASAFTLPDNISIAKDEIGTIYATINVAGTVRVYTDQRTNTWAEYAVVDIINTANIKASVSTARDKLMLLYSAKGGTGETVSLLYQEFDVGSRMLMTQTGIASIYGTSSQTITGTYKISRRRIIIIS